MQEVPRPPQRPPRCGLIVWRQPMASRIGWIKVRPFHHPQCGDSFQPESCGHVATCPATKPFVHTARTCVKSASRLSVVHGLTLQPPLP